MSAARDTRGSEMDMDRTLRRIWRAAGLAALVTALLALAAGPALGAVRWRIDPITDTHAEVGGTLDYRLQLTNAGTTAADGTGGDPIEFTAALAPGLTVRSIGVEIPGAGVFDWTFLPGWSCSGDGPGAPPNVVGATTVTCAVTDTMGARTFLFGFGIPGQPIVTVDVGAGPATRETIFTMSGGGVRREDAAQSAEVTRISSEPPSFGIDMFDGEVTADDAGTPFTQAGGHPYAASTTVDFNQLTSPNPLLGAMWPVAAPKTIIVDLPPGFVVNPAATPTCGETEIAGDGQYRPLCPPASQVGTVVLRVNGFGTTTNVHGPRPLYNLDPPPDAPARFGFNFEGTVVTLTGELRSGSDYGLTARFDNVPEGLAFAGSTLTLWGTPADDVHTPERACPGSTAPQYALAGATCASGAARVAFVRNPTSCTAPGVGLPTRITTDSWREPGRFVSETFVSHLPPGYPRERSNWGAPQGPTDCDRVPFNPTLRGQPTGVPRAGAPTAFAFDLELPQTSDPELVGQADLKKAVVTLPRGVRVSPSSAQGLGACSPAQIALRSTADPTCPASSKIGSLTIETPLLNEDLRGGIYLGTPFDNPFDSLLSLYLVARGPGLIVKLPGKVETNPQTGQLTATFDDNPQLPFSKLHLEFNGGPRAPIVTPDQCGTYTTRAELTGWNGATVVSNSSFTVAQDADGTPCEGQRFAPGFAAGTQDPVAGKSSPFHLRMTRDDQHQLFNAVTVEMPPGLTGRIADAVLCSAAQARTGGCPESSRVGRVAVGAGAGSNPFYITNGRVYITEGYKGAPFGLSIVVPAVAGPFDLGTVVVQSAVFVDKHTAELRVVSDPLPTILQGIPLDVRDVRVSIDREGFMLNPTNCEEMQLNGRIDSTLGSSVTRSSRFQVGDCAALPLRPRMTLAVGGRGRTQRGRVTPLNATLRQTAGQAALKAVGVTLPATINARLEVINDACTREEFEAGDCEDARAGSAVAVTPLLRDPLRGNAYFVRNGNRLPDLFVALRGQGRSAGVAFDLIGRITIPRSRFLRTTFDAVPDVPITMFSLRLQGGRRGSVGNAANLCSTRGRRARGRIVYRGQNGKREVVRQRLRVKGCRRSARARRSAVTRGGQSDLPARGERTTR